MEANCQWNDAAVHSTTEWPEFLLYAYYRFLFPKVDCVWIMV